MRFKEILKEAIDATTAIDEVYRKAVAHFKGRKAGGANINYKAQLIKGKRPAIYITSSNGERVNMWSASLVIAPHVLGKDTRSTNDRNVYLYKGAVLLKAVRKGEGVMIVPVQSKGIIHKANSVAKKYVAGSTPDWQQVMHKQHSDFTADVYRFVGQNVQLTTKAPRAAIVFTNMSPKFKEAMDTNYTYSKKILAWLGGRGRISTVALEYSDIGEPFGTPVDFTKANPDAILKVIM